VPGATSAIAAVGYPYHARELFIASNDVRVFDQHVCKVSVVVAPARGALSLDEARGHTFTRVFIMKDTDDRGAPLACFHNEIGHHLPVFGIEGSRGFIKQQQRLLGDQTARDIDTLLFAAGERGGCQRP